MKITLDVPEEIAEALDADNKNQFFFIDTVLAGVKRPGRPWAYKKTLCSMCGTCCTSVHTWGMRLPMKDGVCVFLKDHPHFEGKKICGWGGNRPFSCCIATPRWEPNCTLTWTYGEEKEEANEPREP